MGDDMILVMDDVNPLNLVMESGSDAQLIDALPYVPAGIKDYEQLSNKPRINFVELIGNRTGEELHLQDELPLITRSEIREIINSL